MRIRFDRGTLVLDRVEPGLAPGILDGASWDSELAAWRMPAEQLSGLRVRLSAAGVRATDDIRPPRLETTWTLPPLRWYQRDAVAAWRGAGDRGVLALPTGSGKTIAAIAAMAELSVATLVLVPTRVLLDQWARTIEGHAAHPVGRLGDGVHKVAPSRIPGASPGSTRSSTSVPRSNRIRMRTALSKARAHTKSGRT